MTLLAGSLSLSGCFFWLPIEEAIVNVPPTITEGFPETGSTIIMSEASTAVTAFILEPDGDEVTCTWIMSSPSGGEPIETARPVVSAGVDKVSCIVDIPYKTSHDGKTLTLIAEDTQGAEARAEWGIEVQEIVQ